MALKLLIGMEHEEGSFRPLNFFQRRRLARIKRIIDRHAPDLKVLGIEGSAEKSLVAVAKAQGLDSGKGEFDEKDRRKLATAICRHTESEGETIDIRHPQVVGAVNSFRNFRDFERTVAGGFFGTFEAARHHAELKGIKVVPLESKDARKKALTKAAEKPEDLLKYKKDLREKLTKDSSEGKPGPLGLFRKVVAETSYEKDDEIILKRNREMIENIGRRQADGAVVAELHAKGIEKEVPPEKREKVVSFWGRLVNMLVGSK